MYNKFMKISFIVGLFLIQVLGLAYGIDRVKAAGPFIYKATIDQFSGPTGVAIDSGGNIYVADRFNHRVQVFNSSRVYSATLGTTGVAGNGNDQFDNPTDVAVDDSTGNIYITDYGNHRVQIFNSSGVYSATLGTGSGNGNDQFNNPAGIAVDSTGNIYVADRGNARVQIFKPGRVYSTTLGTGRSGSGNDQFNKPYGVAVDSTGNIYVADSWNGRVQIFGEPEPPPQVNAISGKVTSSANALSGISVELYRNQGRSFSWEASATTGASGLYRFADLITGTYSGWLF